MRAARTGIGRLSQDQVMDIGKDDVRAISKYLGKKKFMHGDNRTLVSSIICKSYSHEMHIEYLLKIYASCKTLKSEKKTTKLKK